MASTYKTDLDQIAQAYLKNSIDGLGVYRAGNIPPYCSSAGVASYNTNPGEAYPSRSVGRNIRGAEIKALMLNLVQVYINLGYGNWGLHNTDLVTGATWISNGGRALFSLSGNNGARSVAASSPSPSGNVDRHRVRQLYTDGWYAIHGSLSNLNVDLTVCHSSCHISCHGSRGRR